MFAHNSLAVLLATSIVAIFETKKHEKLQNTGHFQHIKQNQNQIKEFLLKQILI